MNIRNALHRAIVIAENARMEKSNLANIQSILHHVKEGVICVNSEKDLIFHNNQALRLLRIHKPEEIRKFHPELGLDAVLERSESAMDRVTRLKGTDLLINSFPLQIASDNGVVCFLQDIKTIKNISRKIETDLHPHGLIARYNLEDIHGRSQGILKLKKNISCYGPTDISVYIHGETGTGKELVAHALHLNSRRAKKPFVGINCATLSDSLFASELFGYEEGAFTGARKGGKTGLFELADGGSIFLDEIGDMSQSAQVGLLRVLDSGEIRRVGGDRFIPVNVRVICASHKQLIDLVKNGSFRQDLFFRLAGICLEIPPLRERMEDIPFLIKEIFKRHGLDESIMNEDIWQRIKNYSWPGNVRELYAAIDAYLCIRNNIGTNSECFEAIFRNRDHLFGAEPANSTLGEKVAAFRKKEASREMEKVGGNREIAAKNLGISLSSLRRILEQTDGKNI